MASWEGKTRGGVLGYRIFVWTLKHAGLSFAYFLLRFVALYYFFASGKAFRASYGFYRTRMGYPVMKSLLSVYRNYYLFGQILLDKTSMLAGISNPFTFNFDGEEHLRKIEGGGLLISGHIGNWEIAGQLLNRLQKTIHIILFDAEHRRIKGYLTEVLKERNVHFIVLREDMGHLQEIRSALEQGHIIAMHGDRHVEGNKTVEVDFLGDPAAFPTGPVNMAARFGVPVSYVFAVKERPRHYHFFATPLQQIPFSGNLQKRDLIMKEAVTVFVRSMEKIVKQYPLQWFNYYDFWQPAGAPVKPSVS